MDSERKPRQNTALVGIAGVHHVVSELSRRNLVALPTIRNIAGIDVVVSTLDGRRHAYVQVKASYGPAPNFQMPRSIHVRTGPNDYYVLLRWMPKSQSYEGFLLTGREARAGVRRAEAKQERRIKAGSRRVIMPVLSVSGREATRAVQWRKKWLSWKLGQGK